MTLRLLAVAAATGRVGVVFLVGNRLMDWGVSDAAAKSREQATTWMQELIDVLGPDVLVTEKIQAASRKGDAARDITEALARVAADSALLNAEVVREQVYDNKYEEAEAIVRMYSDLAPWLQRRERFYDNEPRNTVLFEAMSLALSILRGPSTKLAAAMG